MGLLSQVRQTQIKTGNIGLGRHNTFFARYIEWLDENPDARPEVRSVSIIARCSQSPVVRALIDNADELKARNVTVKAIICYAQPSQELRELTQALIMLSDAKEARELARWANKSCLMDAHEQLTMGNSMCWSGDTMRREPGKCDGLDLFETSAPQTVRLGMLAFHAIWDVSEALPLTAVRGALTARPNASSAHPNDDALAAFSFMSRADGSTVNQH